ncbi:hypothetical protein TL16_g02511 [Triparma laevis f. inornata]|uniref:FAD/NAD(P)-binding domain-containing protein n=1 Tax=Triparma laevis f. inornata TaxID=1714386 RepID=A0A9W6ZP61_9STRA|nr:hypothetical protein TL16_g02511 [Triparma laevis f. inornata]
MSSFTYKLNSLALLALLFLCTPFARSFTLPFTPSTRSSLFAKKEVVILGGGFGGLYTALSFPKRDDLSITLIAPNDRFTFSPLLYELAVGKCSIDEVCPSYDSIFSDSESRNSINFIQSSIDSLSLSAKTVNLSNDTNAIKTLRYDYLIISTGKIPPSSHPILYTDYLKTSPRSQNKYIYSSKNSTLQGQFESINGTWISYKTSSNRIKKLRTSEALLLPSYPLNPPPSSSLINSVLNFTSINDALKLRKKLKTLNSTSKITIVGGGYSGVELCTSLKEILNCEVELIQRGDGVLKNSESEFNVRKSEETLKNNRIDITFNEEVIKTDYIATSVGDKVNVVLSGGGERLADLIIFTQHSIEVKTPYYGDLLLGDKMLIETDECLRCRNIEVKKVYKNIFGLGDIIKIDNDEGKSSAQKSMQQSSIVAYNVLAAVDNRKPLKFEYVDLGEMVSLGGKGLLVGWGEGGSWGEGGGSC